MGRGVAQPDFSGKTIRLYIGTGPGGGYDTYGRLVARHIGRQLPGNPAVLPQNMPGASSLTLTNFLYNSARRVMAPHSASSTKPCRRSNCSISATPTMMRRGSTGSAG
jgi:hypothetical protein